MELNTPLFAGANGLDGTDLSVPTNTITMGIRKIPVTNIQVTDHDNNWHAFTPQEDITPYECALLMVIWTLAASTAGGRGSFVYYDYWQYILDHKLERHFT